MSNAQLAYKPERNDAELANESTVESPIVNEAANATDEKTPFLAIVRKYASVADLLHVFGALAVATAMGLFLIDGLKLNNDLYRFLTLLGFTAALTGAGVLMSRLLNEQRGSRIFIALGLLAVPACFAVFGALIYSVLPLDASINHYPAFAKWTFANIAEIPLAIVAGIFTLTAVTWVGFSVLARVERNWLTITLLASSAFLIIPLRHELSSALIATGALAVTAGMVKKYASKTLALKTAEGKFAICVLFIPAGIIAVRSLLLHQVSGVMLLAFSLPFYIFVRQLLSQRDDANFYTAALNLLAAILSLCITLSLGDTLVHYIDTSWSIIIASTTLLFLAHDIRKVASNRKLAMGVSTIQTLLAVAFLLLVTAFESSGTVAIACSVILLSLCLYCYALRFHAMAALSLVAIIGIAVLKLDQLGAMLQFTGWWGVAALGATTIIAGSLLDRKSTSVQVSIERSSDD